MDFLVQGGVQRVVFDGRNLNTTDRESHTVYIPTLRQPDFNTEVDPLTGTTTMAKVPGYGLTFASSAHSSGEWEWTATAYPLSGSPHTIGAVRVYNNVSPPNSKTIYVDPVSGADGNTGLSALAAVRTVQAGFAKCATAGDMGGGTVVLLPGYHNLNTNVGFYGASSNITSGHWPVTVEVRVGATIGRGIDGVYTATGRFDFTDFNFFDSLHLSSGSIASDRVYVWWKFQDPNNKALIRGDIKFWAGGSATYEIVCEGGRSGHREHDLVTKPASTRFSEGVTEFFDVVSNPSQIRSYCHTREGVMDSFDSLAYGLNNAVNDSLGIVLPVNNRTGTPQCWYSHLLIDACYYSPTTLGGLIDCRPGAAVSITLTGGRMRIQQLAATTIPEFVSGTGDVDIGFHGAELTGSARWIVRCAGEANANNNGSFAVLASGTSGGLPWIELDNPSAVTVSNANAAFVMETVRNTTGQLYRDAVHPDISQVRFMPANGVVFNSVALRRYSESLGWQISSFAGALSKLVMFNCTDGQNVQQNYTNAGMDNCLFLHCTFATEWVTNSQGTGNEWRKCVLGGLSGNTGGGGNVIDQCHFIDNVIPSGATNSTGGAWFAGDYATSPYSFEPSSPNLGSATLDSLYAPIEWYWDDATQPTRGVWRNVGAYDWSTDGNFAVIPELSVAVAATVAPTVVGGGSLEVDAGTAASIAATVDPTVLETLAVPVVPAAATAVARTVGAVYREFTVAPVDAGVSSSVAAALPPTVIAGDALLVTAGVAEAAASTTAATVAVSSVQPNYQFAPNQRRLGGSTGKSERPAFRTYGLMHRFGIRKFPGRFGK